MRSEEAQKEAVHKKQLQHYRTVLKPHTGTFLRRQQHSCVLLSRQTDRSTQSLSYLSIEDVTVVKTIKRRANEKPWLTGEVCSLLRPLLHSDLGTLQDMLWQRAILSGESGKGFCSITDYKPRMCHSDPLLPDELNIFYARFEASHTTQAQPFLPTQNNQVLQLTTAVVWKAPASVTPHKAAGPDTRQL